MSGFAKFMNQAVLERLSRIRQVLAASLFSQAGPAKVPERGESPNKSGVREIPGASSGG
jgi:hypothetical protein